MVAAPPLVRPGSSAPQERTGCRARVRYRQNKSLGVYKDVRPLKCHPRLNHRLKDIAALVTTYPSIAITESFIAGDGPRCIRLITSRRA
jgi:hypothetical protein